jgi:hypothetical protein
LLHLAFTFISKLYRKISIMMLKSFLFSGCLVVQSIVAFHIATPKSVVWKSTPTSSSFASLQATPILEDWKILEDGRLEGKVKNHPDYEDGSIISTSPPANDAVDNAVVETITGNKYRLQKHSTTINTQDNEKFFFPKPTSESSVSIDLQQASGEEENTSDTKKLMQQVKDAGVAGVISYALWELGFWALSVPVCIVAYQQVTGHWPDLTNPDDLEKLGAEAFAFVNVARFAVPLRIGLALGTTPWIQQNIVDRFSNKKDQEGDER